MKLLSHRAKLNMDNPMPASQPCMPASLPCAQFFLTKVGYLFYQRCRGSSPPGREGTMVYTKLYPVSVYFLINSLRLRCRICQASKAGYRSSKKVTHAVYLSHSAYKADINDIYLFLSIRPLILCCYACML